MRNEMIPLDEQPDVRDLLIGFAFFALNYERLIDRLRDIAEALSEPASNDERTGGGWINLVRKLLTNNINLAEADSLIADGFIEKLFELNRHRIELIKGVKYFQPPMDDWPASFIKYEREDGAVAPTTNITSNEVYKMLHECRHLEQAAGFFAKCITKKVDFSDVFSENDGRYTFNLYHLR